MMREPAVDRAALAAAQDALMAALQGRGETPEGFDPEAVRRLGDSLRAKRRRAVARAWPALARALGEAFADRFASYAAAHPMPEAGPGADGCLFARTLLREEPLTRAAVMEILRFELHWRIGPDGRLIARRFALRVVRGRAVTGMGLRCFRWARAWVFSKR